ncbi:MAG: ATP phosphoribosyltransferase (ATP-PRTase) (ATP-PRT) [Peltula sp. TS41687]|nr:MAG: ATP phosphoribosyltransferase (ATP-PRTase) (ATP-PRT) [Peltula sp. TS41687]
MEFVSHLENRLLFAVPKKGRLQQSTLDLLHGSDILFNREHRLDIALVKNLPIALVFLPAADIPTFVGEGRVDLGITGRDQVAEHDKVISSGDYHGWEEVLDLGFGSCKLQIQVPEEGEIKDVQQLVGKHVATSFVNLTEDFFATLEREQEQEDGRTNGTANEGPQSQKDLKTRITFISGSVETACALGVADAVVDLVGALNRATVLSHGSSLAHFITESGDTMRAQGLKAIATVIESTAILIKSKKPCNPSLVDLIASRIRGVITAQKYVLCQYNVKRSALDVAVKITPGKRAPTVNALEEDGWVAVSSMVEKKKIATVMDDLSMVGAHDILVLPISNSRMA